jgi:hypothetical protein
MGFCFSRFDRHQHVLNVVDGSATRITAPIRGRIAGVVGRACHWTQPDLV